MDNERILEELDNLILEGEDKVLVTQPNLDKEFTLKPHVDLNLYSEWHQKILRFLKLFLSNDDFELKKIFKYSENTVTNTKESIASLKGIKASLVKGYLKPKNRIVTTNDENLERIFVKFHNVVRQLRSRHDKRETLNVDDEYDVQDLLHALLRLYFNDIRPEGWSPSHAGKSTRMDFLLMNEKTVIEVKKTRKNLKDKEIGTELIEDIERYSKHPSCNKLICFIYDPDGFIGNPAGLINDLEEKHDGFVKVYIEPNFY